MKVFFSIERTGKQAKIVGRVNNASLSEMEADSNAGNASLLQASESLPPFFYIATE